MSEPWIAVHVALPARVFDTEDTEADYLGSVLFELGAEGLEWQDGPPLTAVASFPPEDGGREALAARVRAYLDERGTTGAVVSIVPIEDIDWSTHWRHHFEPLSFGPDEDPLWIVPSWLQAPKGAGQVLRIDPSSAFGTGLHPTTALCLDWVLETKPTGLLDVGTGTGVLALAAARVGARGVVGVDNDPEAVRVALENRELNGASSVVFADTPVEELDGVFPAVVANILAGPLVELAPALAARVAPGGTLVLSGILPVQADEVVLAYEAEGLLPENLTVRGDWARLVVTRP
ncbi:MAG: 50S ribosomal protein L11 methyltransferase [Myxococcota bacterium]